MRQRLFILILISAVLLLIPAVWSAFGKERESGLNRKEAETQLSQLNIQEKALEQDVARLKTERGVEDALRHRYDVGSSGEGVIYIVDQKATDTGTVETHGGLFGWFGSWWPF
jgi:cell division protein FtsB